MPTIPRIFNWGNKISEISTDLYNQLNRAYNNITSVLSTKTSVYSTTVNNPPASSQFNVNYDIGDFYVRTDIDTAWMMTSRTSSTNVTWTQIT